jgi:NADP-dependent 3-hydroxy acid dehydrogenase YdfG
VNISISTDKSILITDRSSGISLAVVHGLETRGYRIFATARQTTDVAILQQAGFEACQLDLDNSDSIGTAVEWMLAKTGGKLYELFNNAAFANQAPLTIYPVMYCVSSLKPTCSVHPNSPIC